MELSATTRLLMSLGGTSPGCWDLPAGDVVAVRYGCELFGGVESASSPCRIGLGACVAARYDRSAMEALDDPAVPDPTVCLGFLERVSREDPEALRESFSDPLMNKFKFPLSSTPGHHGRHYQG